MLQLTSILVGPEHEEVHGPDLGDLFLLPEQPEHLLTALGCSLLLDKHGGGVITGKKHMHNSLEWCYMNQ